MRQELPMILVRVIVGIVFLFEGTIKFLFPGEYGIGFFAALGLPFAQYVAPTMGGIELAAGAAVLLNFYAGEAAVLLLFDLAAGALTKLPVLFGHPLGPLTCPKLSSYGWFSFLHQARTELFLLVAVLAVLLHSGMQIGSSRRWYQGD